VSALEFRVVEWCDPGEMRGEVLRATYGRLEIRAAGLTLSHLEDLRTRSVRDAIYLPLYPLAEWLALHWWVLLYEAPGGAADGYLARHGLRYAGDGYALPDLQIHPWGERVHLRMRPRCLEGAGVSFLVATDHYLARSELRDALGRFIRLVAERLDQQGIGGTLLQEQWRRIGEITNDPEQEAFCQAAARLGEDPLALDDDLGGLLEQGATRLPVPLLNELCSSAGSAGLADALAWACDARQRLQHGHSPWTPLIAIRRQAGGDPGATLWERGYALAGWLRDQVRLGDEPIPSMEAIGHAFTLADVGQDLVFHGAGPRGISALSWEGSAGAPAFLITRTHPASQRFALCRALYGYLVGASEGFLVTETQSEGQQASRAFAAEFLAPAAALRRRLTTKWVDGEDVLELAEAFGVSDYVIRHQIENHGIGRLVPLTPP
jgi:hypothetical protein